MPELPEVETVVRSVRSHLIGKQIRAVELSSKRVTRAGFEETRARLEGARIEQVGRQGKQILVRLDRGLLYIHLGMTGKLLWNAPRTKFTRAVFHFDDGTLLYDDIRQFGRVESFDAPPPVVEKLGPDALAVTPEIFVDRLKSRSGAVKTLLLNQGFLAGVGNIYADEALFAAGIHPRARASRLSDKRARVLHARLVEVLEASIAHKGSSISDYVDSAGQRGSFQDLHSVYGRGGEPCPRCGTKIRRIVLGQRGTHYCPRCQRA
jgi:formamidopyrimidine-DNA glycosylase